MSFRRRAQAAADGGFSGMGFSLLDLEVAETTYGVSGMAGILGECGMNHRELETVIDGWLEDDWSARSELSWIKALRLVEWLDIRTVKISSMPPWKEPRRRRIAMELRRMAGQAASLGAKVALCFPPWARPTPIIEAVALLEACAHDNLGLVVDPWHVQRSGVPVAEYLNLVAPHIAGVELSDGSRASVGVRIEAINDRRCCGEGDFRLRGLVAAVRRTGFRGPWGVQLISTDHRDLDVAHAMTRAALTTRAVLESRRTIGDLVAVRRSLRH